MKTSLLQMLICPNCLPAEIALRATVHRQSHDDILEGDLCCGNCGHLYPIRDGLAFLEPHYVPRKQEGLGYESPQALSSYLWSHYGDLMNDPEASDAYRQWAALMGPADGPILDIGSAVGRFAFEMQDKCDFVIGIDKSETFIRAARELLTRRCKTVSLPEEGLLQRQVALRLPATWHLKNIEFVVGDAQALPFRSGIFAGLASLNLVDKLPQPLQHLSEMVRVARKSPAQMLVSDPFSWSLEAAEERHWLGGKACHPFPGRGLDNIAALLRGDHPDLRTAWQIEQRGHVWWKIRTHANHFELIRSCFVKACR
ncbi:SAM-dependent methyltransferase [Syntrophotalea carbinolica DSM 2380]|uniref:SAM-dependent methyltransferase n=1 Tax=Syntrophotalea carbinolica (strain DSM 2380 / NBRC 103641 / GraBd1) TaxID=338963 RepID=Q3A121_SYNC1|nr:methyltransferase domain-containing protein [Syntrophotalea carbinolica]ABA89936.1 SAM-dependent methyltransferase [Syntrophotalea carbinolica DSM 2380]